MDQVGNQVLMSWKALSLNGLLTGKKRVMLCAWRIFKVLPLQFSLQLDISREEFKAPQHWLDNYLQRYELSIKRSTTLFKFEDDEANRRALAFKYFIDGIDFSKY